MQAGGGVVLNQEAYGRQTQALTLDTVCIGSFLLLRTAVLSQKHLKDVYAHTSDHLPRCMAFYASHAFK